MNTPLQNVTAAVRRPLLRITFEITVQNHRAHTLDFFHFTLHHAFRAWKAQIRSSSIYIYSDICTYLSVLTDAYIYVNEILEGWVSPQIA